MDGLKRSTAFRLLPSAFCLQIFSSALAQPPPPPAPPADATGVSSTTLGNPYSYLTQTVLDQVLAAHGGLKRLEQISFMDLRLEGTVADGEEIVDVRIRTAQGTGRNFFQETIADGVAIRQGYDGIEYWMTRDGKRVTPLSGAIETSLYRQTQRKRFLQGILDVALPAPGTEYRGRVEKDGRPLDCVQHAGRSGDLLLEYADPATHFLAISERPAMREVVLYDDYRETEGIPLPRRLRIYEMGKPRDEKSLKADLKTVSCSFQPLPDALFAPPEAKAPER